MPSLYHTFFINISRCEELADIPLDRISKKQVLNYMLERSKKDSVSTATVNREAAFIKGMLSRATEWDMLAINQLKSLRLLKEAEKRSVELRLKQASDPLTELPEHIAEIVKFAIH